MTINHEGYLSPFSWRYGSQEMRRLWSEAHKRRLWRQIWVILAEVQAEFGLFPIEKLDALRSNVDAIDLPRALEVEKRIHHDLMAELTVFAEQASTTGGVLHLGATSADIQDNADVLRMRQSMDVLLEKLRNLLITFAERIEQHADEAIIAFTHLQPAEPTTLGYRLAVYAQDLLSDWEELKRQRCQLRGKGFKGAVGSGASFVELLGGERFTAFERRLAQRLGIEFFPITTQVYPRKQDFHLISALAGLGASLYKFSFDLRLLQSPALGEWSEPFGEEQVGSSAMPFKRNPVGAENIDSLARQLALLPRLAWDNAAHSLLERTLDDSANRRSMLPEAFLIADEILERSAHILQGLNFHPLEMKKNLERFAPFAGIERLLVHLVKAGADRQVMHGRLRQHALQAWNALQLGAKNPLVDLICTDKAILAYLSAEEVRALMDAYGYVGNAPQRARTFAQHMREMLSESSS